MEGTAWRMLSPPGTMTSISVDGDGRTPRFCAGREKLSTSPGKALYPMDFDRVATSPSRVLVTIIESSCATKSIPTTFKSMTIVATPIISCTGSQTITPLLL